MDYKYKDNERLQVRSYRTFYNLPSTGNRKELTKQYQDKLKNDTEFQEYDKIFQSCKGLTRNLSKIQWYYQPHISFKFCGFPPSAWANISFNKENIEFIKSVCVISQLCGDRYRYFKEFYNFKNTMGKYDIVSDIDNQIIETIETDKPWYELGKKIKSDNQTKKYTNCRIERSK